MRVTRKKIIILVIVFLLLVTSSILYLFLSKPSGSDYEVRQLNLTFDSSVSVQGGEIIGSDGIGIYHYNTEKNSKEYKYIYTSRMPSIKTMATSKDGALLVFSDSFINTPVDQYAINNSVNVFDISQSIWYLSFKNKTLKPLSISGKDSKIIFNQSKNMFYIAQRMDDGVFIQTYNPNNETLNQPNIATSMLSISKLFECYGENFCLSGQDTNGNVIKEFHTKDNTVTTRTSSSQISVTTPFSDSASFVLSNRSEGGNLDDEVIETYSNLTLKQGTDTIASWKGEYQNDSIFAVKSNETYYVINDESGTYEKVGVNTFGFKAQETKQLLLPNDEEYTGGFTSYLGSIRGSAILSSSNGGVVSFTPTSSPGDAVVNTTPQSTENTIRDCGKSTIRSITFSNQVNQFEVSINDDERFTTTIQSINQCLSNQPNKVGRYTIHYTGLSSINGRKTTD